MTEQERGWYYVYMKKYISLLLVVGVVLGGSTLAYAQGKTPAKATVSAEAQTSVREQGEVILQRMAQVLAQQAVLGTLLESRVAKLKDRKANVTAAIAKVKDTHDSWDRARITFEALPAALEESLAGTPEEAAVAIRTLLEGSRDDLKAVNKRFGEAIAAVRKAADSVPAAQ